MANGRSGADLKSAPGPLGTPGRSPAWTTRLLLKPWFVDRRDEGAELAFEVLVRRHGAMVLRVCSQLLDDRHAAEDAFQAVFLVLARRAASIRRPEQLAPWLHGVALRTAKEARSRERKRRRIELRGATMQPTDSGSPEHPLDRLEQTEALHGEIARLPDRYRGPVVLCDLEGLTQQEAATRLRCPPGTVAIRLKRARERLRARLSRRGLDPSAGVMALTLNPATLPSLSTSLVESTVRGSMAIGCASASVVSLAEGVQWTMTLAKWKTATATASLILALGLAATWGVSGNLPPKPDEQPTQDATIPQVDVARPVSREVHDYEDFTGRIELSRSEEIRVPGRRCHRKSPSIHRKGIGSRRENYCSKSIAGRIKPSSRSPRPASSRPKPRWRSQSRWWRGTSASRSAVRTSSAARRLTRVRRIWTRPRQSRLPLEAHRRPGRTATSFSPGILSPIGSGQVASPLVAPGDPIKASETVRWPEWSSRLGRPDG